MLRFVYVGLVLALFSLFPSWSNAALAQSPDRVTPPFYQIAPCPTCVNPSGTVPVGSVQPSSGMGNAVPSVYTPCDTSITSDNATSSRHKSHNGAVSNFMQQLLQFFLQLINTLLQLLGGGQVPMPSQPQNPSVHPTTPAAPTYSAQPTPCVGVTAAVEPSGTAPIPTAGVVQRPSITVPSSSPQSPQNCDGTPITITQGGTYSGCYKSTNASTPAVKISTTAPVTIDHATIIHAGRGIESSMNGVHVTVNNSKIQAIDPGEATIQRAILLRSPGSLVAEHNLLVDGQGIWVVSGNPSIVRIRYNDVKNIGRYPHTDQNGCCVQFVQFTESTVGNAEIAWNRTMNIYKQSDIEDNINMYKSSGTAAHPIDIHHNLISGAYPPSGNGSGFTGGGILGGDSGGNYTKIHDNRVVSTSNYGVAITGGHDNHIYNNRIVNDGKADDGTAVGPSTASGISLWQYDPNAATGPNTTAYNNTIGWLQPSGRRNDSYMPACNPANACTNNVSMPDPTASTEQAERDAWAADLSAAGLTVGTNW